MGKRKDALWNEHCQLGKLYPNGKGQREWQCRYCAKSLGGSLSRLKAHLAHVEGAGVLVCDKVPEHVKQEMHAKFFSGADVESNVCERPAAAATDAPLGNAGDNVISSDSQHHASPAQSEHVPSESMGTVGGSSRASAPTSAPPSQLLPMSAQLHANATTRQVRQRQTTMFDCSNNEKYKAAEIAERQLFFANALPFNLVNSPFYHNYVVKLGEAGSGYASRRIKYEALRVKHLNEECLSLHDRTKPLREGWRKYGVTIVSDGWKCGRKRSIVNFVAVSIHGCVFLKSVEASEHTKTGEWLYSQLKPIIEEIGPENVVQLVTDNAGNCVKMGSFLVRDFPHIVHGRCVCHVLDLLLEDIGKLEWVAPLIKECVSLVKFFTSHEKLLAAFRKIAPRDLVRPASTRFAYSFLVISQFVDDKMLRAMKMFVLTDDWVGEWSKTPGADNAEALIKNGEFWTACTELLVIMGPILKVLKLADKEGATMGLMFECMDHMQESLAKLAKDNIILKSKIDVVLRFIHTETVGMTPGPPAFDDLVFDDDEMNAGVEDTDLADDDEIPSKNRWAMMHNKLQSVGRLLHPLWLDLEEDEEAKSDMFDYFEMIAPGDLEKQRKLNDQYNAFRRAAPRNMQRELAKARDMRLKGVNWWESFGCSLPDLKTVALRVLSQPTSASAAERNWSVWSLIQTKRRARLKPENMEKLVYCYCNLRLMKLIEDRGMALMEVNVDELKMEAQWQRLVEMQLRMDDVENFLEQVEE